MWRDRRYFSRSSISLFLLGFRVRASAGVEDRSEGNKHGVHEGGEIDDGSMHNKIIVECDKANRELI